MLFTIFSPVFVECGISRPQFAALFYNLRQRESKAYRKAVDDYLEAQSLIGLDQCARVGEERKPAAVEGSNLFPTEDEEHEIVENPRGTEDTKPDVGEVNNTILSLQTSELEEFRKELRLGMQLRSRFGHTGFVIGLGDNSATIARMCTLRGTPHKITEELPYDELLAENRTIIQEETHVLDQTHEKKGSVVSQDRVKLGGEEGELSSCQEVCTKMGIQPNEDAGFNNHLKKGVAVYIQRTSGIKHLALVDEVSPNGVKAVWIEELKNKEVTQKIFFDLDALRLLNPVVYSTTFLNVFINVRTPKTLYAEVRKKYVVLENVTDAAVNIGQHTLIKTAANQTVAHKFRIGTVIGARTTLELLCYRDALTQMECASEPRVQLDYGVVFELIARHLEDTKDFRRLLDQYLPNKLEQISAVTLIQIEANEKLYELSEEIVREIRSIMFRLSTDQLMSLRQDPNKTVADYAAELLAEKLKDGENQGSNNLPVDNDKTLSKGEADDTSEPPRKRKRNERENSAK